MQNRFFETPLYLSGNQILEGEHYKTCKKSSSLVTPYLGKRGHLFL